MNNLIFSLNASMPIFLTMIIGCYLNKAGIFTDAITNKINKFVFTFALPALLFEDLSEADFFAVWDTKFVLFCFFVTLFSILIVIGLSYLLKDKSIQGEFIQASYRSSAAILGIAFIQNIYGKATIAPLMIVATVPLYNIMAVIVLAVFKPNREAISFSFLKKTFIDILKNPIIIGIFAGCLWSVLKLPRPVILYKTIHNISVLATPLGLISMGASFRFSEAFKKWKIAVICSMIKLLGFTSVFIPMAVVFGFHTEKLIAILVMLGSATTVSSYVMAKNMGHEGTVTASCVMLSTMLCAFTLTMWLFILKVIGLI